VAPGPPFSVGHTTMVLIDHTRTEALPDGTRIARRLRTLVFYPLAPTRRAFPLLLFGHGFAVTPLTYGALLRYWAAQGFVVAAPFFPLESRNAPGGPNETDLPNQPGDMRFLISRLLSISAGRTGVLSHLINPSQIAVSGQSDGGDTALAVAYGGGQRDPRVRAAVILSGAEIPGLRLSYFSAGEPKYLLTLPGARHLPPYQRPPDLGIVERVTVAFLRRYLEHDRQAGRQLSSLGNVPGLASLAAVLR
jgi:dienelactone hydrolase